MITKNVGPTDKAIRIVVGAGIALVSYFALSGVASIVGYIISVALILTATFGFCGLYTLLGINTCKLNAKEGSKGTK